MLDRLPACCTAKISCLLCVAKTLAHALGTFFFLRGIFVSTKWLCKETRKYSSENDQVLGLD